MIHEILYANDYRGLDLYREYTYNWFECYQDAVERFSQDCLDDGEVSREEEITIVSFYLDDDGEPVILSKKKHDIVFEYYHGDLVEHGTWT